MALSRHSYQAGLWDADTMALHQYTEGLRRGMDRCQRLSSVNDGAPWIERITYTNFPEAIQVVDWHHDPPEVRQAPGYFQGNQTRMHYDYFRETGYPIGSGTVESAANNVVHHRMRRPGRGWQRDNAQAMLPERVA